MIMHVRALLVGLAVALAAAGCGSSSSAMPGEPRYTIVKPEDQASQTRQGIPPDKEAEIQLVLQQREPSARKCYQDVLNEKHDRTFAGSVKVVIAIQPTGKASSVKVVGGS